jgi:hypothetical protein
MKKGNRIWPLALAGAFLACTAFLSELRSKAQSELQQATWEMDRLGMISSIDRLTYQRGQENLARAPDSDRERIIQSQTVIADRLSRDSAAREELDTRIVPSLQDKLFREGIAIWVCGVCGAFFLGVYLLRIGRREQGTE